MAQKQEPRLDNLIDNSDNLDEQLSVVEFIKTLKKADSTTESINGKAESSSSQSQDSGDDKRKLNSADKRSSASELLSNMRRRFVHRATEPVFSQLDQKKGAQGSEEGRGTGSSGGSDNQLKMPPFEACNTILLDRKTDSEPALSSTTNTYNKR